MITPISWLIVFIFGAKSKFSSVAIGGGKFLPQVRAHALALLKTVEVELFVGRMGIVIRQTNAKQQRVRSEDILKLVHDGNRAAFAHEHRLRAEGFFQRAQSGLCPTKTPPTFARSSVTGFGKIVRRPCGWKSPPVTARRRISFHPPARRHKLLCARWKKPSARSRCSCAKAARFPS